MQNNRIASISAMPMFPCLRWNALRIVATLVSLLTAQVATASTAGPRQTQSLDADWRFHPGELAGMKLRRSQSLAVWRWKSEPRGEAGAAEMAEPGIDVQGAGWQETTTGTDVFKGHTGFAWYRTTLGHLPGPGRMATLQVDDNAVVYLNGQRLARHTGCNEAFEVSLDTAWRESGANELAVLVENTAGFGGITRAQVGNPNGAPDLAGGVLDAAYDDAAWQQVDVPHDWSIYGPFDKNAPGGGANGFRPQGIGWYRKTFPTPRLTRDPRCFIDFEGVYGASDVWLNGVWLGRHLNGYLDFGFDITAHLKPTGRQNILVVRVDNSVPNTSRWYTGSGIYRHVRLLSTGNLHVPRWGTYVITPVITDAEARVRIETTVSNAALLDADCRLRTDILDPQGHVVAGTESIALAGAGKSRVFCQELLVKRPLFWSCEAPVLYRAISRVSKGTALCDRYETPFGIRTVDLTPDRGLLLNGKKVFVKGVNLHHDNGCLGAAAFDRAIERRLELLKEMGVNGLRLSHNPHASHLLELCDRMGILVFDECFDKWSGQYNGWVRPFEDTWRSDMGDWLKRDRNHPSVFIWSVGNEVSQECDGAKGYGVAQLKELVDLVHQQEPTRKVTCGLYPTRANGVVIGSKAYTLDTKPAEMAFAMDVMSVNYASEFFARDHARYPNLILLMSEAATSGGAQVFFTYDHGYTVGQFYWGGIDYIGESAWPYKTWAVGLMNPCGFKRPIGWHVQAAYSCTPMVHLATIPIDATAKEWVWNDVTMKHEAWDEHWNYSPGRQVRVVAYSNCDCVELFQDGRSLGKHTLAECAQRIFPWELPFTPGVLRAVGYRDGKAVAKDALRTAGPAKRIILMPDRSVLAANGQDLSHIIVSVVDANNTLVTDAQNRIQFKVTGAGSNAGVDNGKPDSDEPWQADQRSAFKGRALLVVKSVRQAGTISVQAQAEGLEPAQVMLSVKEAKK